MPLHLLPGSMDGEAALPTGKGQKEKKRSYKYFLMDVEELEELEEPEERSAKRPYEVNSLLVSFSNDHV